MMVGCFAWNQKKRSAIMIIGERRRVVLNGLARGIKCKCGINSQTIFTQKKKRGDGQVQRQRSLTECL